MNRFLLFLSVIVCCACPSYSQMTLQDYRVVPMCKSMDLITGQSTEIFGPGTFWELSSAIDLPFDFYYLDQAYNQIKVSTGGFITFDVSITYNYSSGELDDINPKNTLAPLWDDLCIRDNGKIHYQVSGESPNRIFIVEFYHVIWGISTSPKIDFQLVLFEGSNDIEFRYGAMEEAGFGADGASIGIKDDLGNFINALDGSRDVPQSSIMKSPGKNYRFSYSPPPPDDIGVSDIQVAACWFIASPDSVKVIIKNYGNQEQTGFSVKYQIAGEDPVEEVVDEVLLPGARIAKTFSTRWEPKTSGIFAVHAWTELDGDANLCNDSLFLEDAILVYDIELPPPVNIEGDIDGNNKNNISWDPGEFTRPLPGEWNGLTSEGQKVHMLVNYNSATVDSCEIYYTIEGDPFPYPKMTYSKQPITNNEFSIYYEDQYGKMNTDVKGTFIPADSCTGTWRGAVYVNDVYTVFSGTWYALAEFDTPVLLGYLLYRDTHSDIQPAPSSLIAETGPEITSYVDSEATAGIPYYYTVVANYDYGHSTKSEEVALGGVGLNDPSADPMKIFPNPVNDILSIHTNIEGKYFIHINSLNGISLGSLEVSDPAIQLDLSHYRAGIYFITIRSKDVVLTRKISKL